MSEQPTRAQALEIVVKALKVAIAVPRDCAAESGPTLSVLEWDAAIVRDKLCFGKPETTAEEAIDAIMAALREPEALSDKAQQDVFNEFVDQDGGVYYDEFKAAGYVIARKP